MNCVVCGKSLELWRLAPADIETMPRSVRDIDVAGAIAHTDTRGRGRGVAELHRVCVRCSRMAFDTAFHARLNRPKR